MLPSLRAQWICPAPAAAILIMFAHAIPAPGDDSNPIPQQCAAGQLDPGFCACIAQDYPGEPYADCLLSLVATNQIDLAAAQTITDLIGPTGILEQWTNSQGAACYTDICRVPYCGEYNPQCVHLAPLCVDWDFYRNCISGYGCVRDPWTGYFLCDGNNNTADTAGCYNWDGGQICVVN